MPTIHPKAGDITDDYPYGYGYCQCGCGRQTYAFSSNSYRKYLPFHKWRDLANKARLRIKKLDRNVVSKEVIEKLYIEENKSLREVGNSIGCSDKTVRGLLERYSTRTRNQSEARLLAIKKGKFKGLQSQDIDESFFSTWTPEMAWILGLIFTDGYMQGNDVKLALIDIDVLEKVKFHMKYSGDIKKRVNNKSSIYVINICREKIASDLRRLGVHQAKSFTILFPEMPDSMVRHFIRGCWDGDGGFSISKNKYSAHYTSGSKEFMITLANKLFQEGVYREKLKKSSILDREYRKYHLDQHIEIHNLKQSYADGKFPLHIHKRKNSEAYDIRIGSPYSLKNLYNYLYKSVDESIYMNRKFQKISKIIIALGLGN